MSFSPDVVLRPYAPYAPDDEAGWLRCRLLSFFATCYYDDVHTSRGVFELPSVQLVAAVGDQIAGQIVGLVDVEIDGAAATIDCIAVHPDHQRAGIGARLLEAAFEVLPDTVTTLDAWTREDEGALAWYARHGFTERFRYLHSTRATPKAPQSSSPRHRYDRRRSRSVMPGSSTRPSCAPATPGCTSAVSSCASSDRTRRVSGFSSCRGT